jgi:hypothetical protein
MEDSFRRCTNLFLDHSGFRGKLVPWAPLASSLEPLIAFKMGQSKRTDLLPGAVRGVTKSSLWKSWKLVRKELKNSSIRDVADFLDYDVHPDVWIDRLLSQIESGEYEPDVPRRFTLGKSKGFSRTMTLPSVPDLVLYRAIVNYVYARSKRRRHKHVYFSRDELGRAQKKALDEGIGRMTDAADSEISGYSSRGTVSYYNWLRFDQYRKHLLFKDTHDFIVVTDIANFFDTVLHSHVAKAVQSLPIPPRMAGLLFFLLERLSIRQDYASSHGISLPTDEFDCSRTLAHMVLFAHDDAMVRLVGEQLYVRWMDDQNMAVATRAEGLTVLGEVGRSLGRLHLSPNTQKSKILSLEDARRHYHLDLNGMLDEAGKLTERATRSKTARLRFQRHVRSIWRKARPHDGIGEFGKVLKRLYRFAGLAQLPLLRERAVTDILADPSLTERIADYYRCTGSITEYLDFFESIMADPEQIYPDVNLKLTESLLRLEPRSRDLGRLRQITARLLRIPQDVPGAEDCAAVATLLVLRFGDSRTRKVLRHLLDPSAKIARRHVVRAAAFVYATESKQTYEEVLALASRTYRNHLSTLVRLIGAIRDYKEVPERYRNRLNVSLDSVAGVNFIDTRVVLTVKLLLLNERVKVKHWVIERCRALLQKEVSKFDRTLLGRIIRPHTGKGKSSRKKP